MRTILTSLATELNQCNGAVGREQNYDVQVTTGNLSTVSEPEELVPSRLPFRCARPLPSPVPPYFAPIFEGELQVRRPSRRTEYLGSRGTELDPSKEPSRPKAGSHPRADCGKDEDGYGNQTKSSLQE